MARLHPRHRRFPGRCLLLAAMRRRPSAAQCGNSQHYTQATAPSCASRALQARLAAAAFLNTTSRQIR